MIRRSLLHFALMLGLVLLAPGTGYSDPVQGAVLGAGAGAVIGGGAGAAVGAVLGGAGGAAARSKEQEEQARWQNYYEQQEKSEAQQGAVRAPTAAAGQPASLAVQPSEPEPPLPTGSGLIKEIQRSLIVLGYDPGPVDGLTDGPTINAIRSYQEDHGLMTTGKASRTLLQHMRQGG